MSERSPIIVTAGVVVRDSKVLVAQRKAGSHLEGLWEFPGGKLEPNESPEECLAREFKEELGVDVVVGRIQEVVFHRYPEKNVLLLFYACELVDGEPRPLDVADMAWVNRRELACRDWVPADIGFVQKLANDFEKEISEPTDDPPSPAVRRSGVGGKATARQAKPKG